MIDVPTSLKVFVIAAAIVTLIAGMINGAALRTHLRRRHPQILRKLGYPPGMRGLVRPEHDSQVAKADWALWRFLSRREFVKVRDHRLSMLAERQLWLVRLGILLLIVLGVGLFVVSVHFERDVRLSPRVWKVAAVRTEADTSKPSTQP